MEMVKFNLFGAFSISRGDVLLTEKDFHSKKLIQLLTYFLINRADAIPQQKLIDDICDPNTKGPADTLKNLIYRLRTVLKPLGDEEFIKTIPGAYQWNPEIEVDADYERFEKLIEKIELTRPGRDLKEMCQEGLDYFKEDFTNKLTGQSWMANRLRSYEETRVELVKLLCRAEELEENWTGLERVCENALTFEGLDEDIHCWMIRSFCGQKRYEDAIRHYEVAKRTIYESTGEKYPEKLMKVYQDVICDVGRFIRNIGTVLVEAAEAEQPKGAYNCDYDTFRQIYQVEARKSSRLNRPEGVTEHIMLLSIVQLHNFDEQEATTEELEEVMEILNRTVQSSLRVGDVFSKCSSTQFIILLGACTLPNADMVAHRIQKNFKRNLQRRPFQLVYDLDSMKTYEFQQQLNIATE